MDLLVRVNTTQRGPIACEAWHFGLDWFSAKGNLRIEPDALSWLDLRRPISLARSSRFEQKPGE
jgi:hypothetical protein